LAGLGFELRASHLLGRCATTWITSSQPPSLYFFKLFSEVHTDIASSGAIYFQILSLCCLLVSPRYSLNSSVLHNLTSTFHFLLISSLFPTLWVC
jgi:hypothetical protein